MQCNRKIRYMFSSVIQQSHCFISPCGIFRMPGYCYFHLMGQGEGSRELERGIWVGESVTLETALKAGSGGGMLRLPTHSSTSFTNSNSNSNLCATLSFLIRWIGFSSMDIYCTQPCARCPVGCKAEGERRGWWRRSDAQCTFRACPHKTWPSTSQM